MTGPASRRSAHPHRVVVTNIVRTEVYQKIGGAELETGGVSPEGPHTQSPAKASESGRTHSAKTPIPGGADFVGAACIPAAPS